MAESTSPGTPGSPRARSDKERARAAHRPSRRQEMIEAATRVFAEQGPGASVAAIAREGGFSTAALYYHFSGKEELFIASVRDVAQQIETATEAAEERASESTIRMRDAVEAVWRWAAEHRSEARVLYSWAASGPKAAREARAGLVAYYRSKVLDRIPGRPRQNPIDDLVDQLAAGTYVTLAMGISEAWVNGELIDGTDDQVGIVESLTAVSRRLTGAP